MAAATYAETGKILAKYDVGEPRLGGEYPLQDGFGWINGVASAIDERWPDSQGRATSCTLIARRRGSDDEMLAGSTIRNFPPPNS